MISEKILITGSTGFVGSYIAPRLSDDGYDLIALTRKSGASGDSIENIPFGSKIPDTVAKTIERHQVNHVLHIAGRINGTTEELRESNEKLTSALLEGIKKSGIDIQFIYISSVSAIQGLGAYGVSKRNCEKMLETSMMKKWKILRPSLVYGPGDTKNVAGIIQWIKYSPVVPVVGKKEIILQPLYVEDLYLVIKAILEGKGENRVAYTLAGPAQVPLEEMVRLIQHTLKRRNIFLPIPLKPVRTVILTLDKLFPRAGFPVQQVQSSQLQPLWSSHKAIADFGFNPRSMEDGINEFLP